MFPEEADKQAANLVLEELAILALQQCPICDGLGHSIHDCATNNKLENLKKVPVVGLVITALRKEARLKQGGKAPEVVSLLRPKPSKRFKAEDATSAKADDSYEEGLLD